MTGPIIFSNETAREQLVEHGEVVTFRASERTTGATWWRDSRTGPKRGDVLVEEQAVVCPRSSMVMEHFVDKSGFDDVEGWQRAIGELHGPGDRVEIPDGGVLYRVTIDEEDRE